MITVEQPEANIERDFLIGQEFLFKLDSAMVYCFTFRNREKTVKQQYVILFFFKPKGVNFVLISFRFCKEHYFIKMKEESDRDAAMDAEILDRKPTIAVHMVFLYIINFNNHVTNVKSTCDINMDLLPAQVYSCEVEAGRSHEFVFTWKDITVSKLCVILFHIILHWERGLIQTTLKVSLRQDTSTGAPDNQYLRTFQFRITTNRTCGTRTWNDNPNTTIFRKWGPPNNYHWMSWRKLLGRLSALSPGVLSIYPRTL